MTDNLIKKAESKLTQADVATAQRGNFAVPASPFNGVKLELAVALVLIILVSAAASPLIPDRFEWFVFVFCLTLLASLRITYRTRAVLRQLQNNAADKGVKHG